MLRYRLRRIETFMNRSAGRGGEGKPAPRPLRTPQDVIELLHEQVEAVRGDPWASPVERARVIAYLAGIARKTLETGVLAARLEMLELVLKNSPGESRP